MCLGSVPSNCVFKWWVIEEGAGVKGASEFLHFFGVAEQCWAPMRDGVGHHACSGRCWGWGELSSLLGPAITGTAL